jgi:hypothetical protein
MAQDRVQFVNLEGGSSLAFRSCRACHRRKVRCNRVYPCENCVRNGAECTFPPPGRKPRKSPTTSNKSDLTSRLNLLEQQVEKLGKKCADGVATTHAQKGQSGQESPESSRAAGSWPWKTRATHLQGRAKEPNTSIHEGLGAPNTTSRTLEGSLEHQFGRLVIDRSHGTSRYLNHPSITELGVQVNYFSSSRPRYEFGRTMPLNLLNNCFKDQGTSGCF